MNRQFTRVSSKNPCPICKKTDWCEIGDRAACCMRVESSRPARNGGWYHPLDSQKVTQCVTFRPPRPKPKSGLDFGLIHERILSETSGTQISLLAQGLRVSRASLDYLGAGFSKRHQAYSFPMHDGDGKIVGIRLRNSEGKKWAIMGSRQGIFIPEMPQVEHKVCYLPEGATDTAALLSMGLFAIGRPTCMSGNEMIAQALKRLGIYRAVIVADNDGIKKYANRDARPGIIGAQKLKKELRLASVIWMPPSPIKDAREFYNRGGTKELIENEVNQKIWSKS